MKIAYKRALWALLGLCLLAADAGITWRLATQRTMENVESAPASAAATADPISDYRLEREQQRARQEAQLNELIYSEGDGELAGRAKAQLMDLLARTEQETILEGILRARGFEDALVTVSDRAANVLVRREALTQRETAVILDLVLRETGLTGGNVKIIPVK